MRELNILFTSAGRRVELLSLFQQALTELGIQGKVIAGDMDITAPTLHRFPGSVLLPPISDHEYLASVLKVCAEHEISLLIPLMEPELDLLAQTQGLPFKNKPNVMVSSAEAMKIIQDKAKTADFFESVNVATPRTCIVSGEETGELLREIGLPLILKPRYGFGSRHIFRCDTVVQLERALGQASGPYVAQQFVSGAEVTIDVFGDGLGNTLSLVPRKRLKVRAGEVERGVTIPDGLFRQDVLKVVEALKPYGAINIQCIVTPSGPMYTEINGRFGGGYPLSHAAGARFPQLLLQMHLDLPVDARLGKYKVGLLMSRHDQAVYKPVSHLPNGNRLLDLS